MNASVRLIVAAVVLALVQIGFLSWAIVGRAAVLRDGQEVLLRIRPVDPRDLLRGDYVILTYDISSIAADLLEKPLAMKRVESGDVVYVRLARGADGYWIADAASLGARPSDKPDTVVLRGTTTYARDIDETSTIDVDYGIERFYLPEGEGKAIENDLRERPFGVRVAVSDSGAGQVKALMDGDTLLFQEPLY